jgi:hypothetical protein
MKKLLFVKITATVLLLTSCATISNFWNSNEALLTAAFGDAIRSLEGQAIDNIPGAIMALRRQWLPAGAQWDHLVATQIQAYVAAHPNNRAEINKVLEALATQLNLSK